MINPRDKRRESIIVEALQNRIAARFTRAMARNISKTMKTIADNIESPLMIHTVIFDQSAELGKIISSVYRQSISTFGGRVLNNAKELHGSAWVLKNPSQEQWESEINAFVVCGIHREKILTMLGCWYSLSCSASSLMLIAKAR